jgi:hypothetical protein
VREKTQARLQQWEREQQAINGTCMRAVVDKLRLEDAELVNDTW